MTPEGDGPVVGRVDRGAVFLLSDYGYGDEFAGVTRAVVLRHAPGAPVLDITHGVPAFDVRAGALALVRSAPHLGPGVVVAVVDPGVASGRRAVAVEIGPRRPARDPGGAPVPFTGVPRFFVGPDNGLLTWAVDALGGASAVVALPGGPGGPGTFDGRDVFAPVAARLWLGEALDDVGTPVDPAGLVRLTAPALSVVAPGPSRQARVEAEALWADRFGNVQLAAGPSDLTRARLGPDIELSVGSTTLRVRHVGAFSDLGEEELGLMVDANGHLAVVCDRRSAATVLDVRPGDVVILRRSPATPAARVRASRRR